MDKKGLRYDTVAKLFKISLIASVLDDRRFKEWIDLSDEVLAKVTKSNLNLRCHLCGNKATNYVIPDKYIYFFCNFECQREFLTFYPKYKSRTTKIRHEVLNSKILFLLIPFSAIIFIGLGIYLYWIS
jgi:hypothetical protein